MECLTEQEKIRFFKEISTKKHFADLSILKHSFPRGSDSGSDDTEQSSEFEIDSDNNRVKKLKEKDYIKPGSKRDFKESVRYMQGAKKPEPLEHLPPFDDSDEEE